MKESVTVIEGSNKIAEGQIIMGNRLKYHLMVIPCPRSCRINISAGKAKSSFSIQKDKSKVIYKLLQHMNLTCKGY